MHDNSRHLLIELAEKIERFLNLPPEEQEWMLPLLSKNVRTAVEILQVLGNKKLTYAEIGAKVNLHPTTVSQKLNSLADGGIPLDLQKETVAYKTTGRGQNLIRLSTKTG